MFAKIKFICHNSLLPENFEHPVTPIMRKPAGSQRSQLKIAQNGSGFSGFHVSDAGFREVKGNGRFDAPIYKFRLNHKVVKSKQFITICVNCFRNNFPFRKTSQSSLTTGQELNS